jgi:hypothetical protein
MQKRLINLVFFAHNFISLNRREIGFKFRHRFKNGRISIKLNLI